MEIPVIYVFTHDSIGVGEDGPTHQPIEQLARAARDPRPRHAPPGRRQRGGRGLAGDHAAAAHEPAALVLSRQALPTLDRTKYAPASGLAQGRLRPGRRRRTASPTCILIGTGSEVVARASRRTRQLTREGIKARVVSMPSWELFDDQAQEYRDSVLPPTVHGPRLGRAGVAPSAGSATSASSGTDHRHAAPSAPRPRSRTCMKKFGFTPERVVAAAKEAVRARS